MLTAEQTYQGMVAVQWLEKEKPDDLMVWGESKPLLFLIIILYHGHIYYMYHAL
jgi:hypothetical protein